LKDPVLNRILGGRRLLLHEELTREGAKRSRKKKAVNYYLSELILSVRSKRGGPQKGKKKNGKLSGGLSVKLYLRGIRRATNKRGGKRNAQGKKRIK